MIQLTPTADNQFDIISDIDYKKIISQSEDLMDKEKIESACQIRLDAAEQFLDVIYNDEEIVEINMQNSDNHPFIEILYLSGNDHYYIGDFDMGAAFAEQVLELDPEDHFGATTLAGFCYAGLNEWESLEECVESKAINKLEENFLTWFMNVTKGNPTKIDNDVSKELTNCESELLHKILPLKNAFPEVFKSFSK